MFRRLLGWWFSLATAASILVLMALVACWAASPWWSTIAKAGAGRHDLVLISTRWSLCWIYDVWPGAPAWRPVAYGVYFEPALHGASCDEVILQRPRWRVGGITYSHRPAGMGSIMSASQTSGRVLLGYPVLLALVLPTGRVTHAWRRRRIPGLCPRCGYDLRASKERCPECGTRIPAAPRRS